MTPASMIPGTDARGIIVSAACTSAPVAALLAAVGGVIGQVLDTGPGSPLREDVAAVAAAIADLQVGLGLRMDAWARTDSLADPVGAAAAAGLSVPACRDLRRAASFTRDRPELRARWRGHEVTAAQVRIVDSGTGRLPGHQRDVIAAQLAPVLPGMTQDQTRATVEAAVQIAAPGDAKQRERGDHARRRLVWTGVGGGAEFNAYLPEADAGALIAAIDAIAEQLRTEDDYLTIAQRRADALAELVARAAAHGLPTGGGLPAALTITVSATEAQRIAATDPAAYRGGARPDAATTSHGRPAGDAAVRFALCCAPITPAHHHQPPADSSLLARIARTPIAPLQLGRTVRLATTAQRRALQLRDGGCTIPGCTTSAAYTQPHHVKPWNLDGPTDLANLTSLCWAHHRQVELGIWIIEPAQPHHPRPWQARRC